MGCEGSVKSKGYGRSELGTVSSVKSRNGHWVVIDSIGEDDMIAVRDPDRAIVGPKFHY